MTAAETKRIREMMKAAGAQVSHAAFVMRMGHHDLMTLNAAYQRFEQQSNVSSFQEYLKQSHVVDDVVLQELSKISGQHVADNISYSEQDIGKFYQDTQHLCFRYLSSEDINYLQNYGKQLGASQQTHAACEVKQQQLKASLSEAKSHEVSENDEDNDETPEL